MRPTPPGAPLRHIPDPATYRCGCDIFPISMVVRHLTAARRLTFRVAYLLSLRRIPGKREPISSGQYLVERPISWDAGAQAGNHAQAGRARRYREPVGHQQQDTLQENAAGLSFLKWCSEKLITWVTCYEPGKPMPAPRSIQWVSCCLPSRSLTRHSFVSHACTQARLSTQRF